MGRCSEFGVYEHNPPKLQEDYPIWTAWGEQQRGWSQMFLQVITRDKAVLWTLGDPRAPHESMMVLLPLQDPKGIAKGMSGC